MITAGLTAAVVVVVAHLLLLLLLLEFLQLLSLLVDVMRRVFGDGVDDGEMPVEIPSGIKGFVAKMASQTIGRRRPTVGRRR